ncbi:MAG: calcium/sodium antiporter [Planctomycetia bacterium]|nr:calcium/sodium antiporter [Planctomycetia bacterium]
MLTSILYVVCGGILLLFGGEILVRGASGIAGILRISPLIIGLTIVAACTGAPETAVSLTGALCRGSADIAVGNVVGSNIANILLVLGITAIICPIGVSSRLIKKEIPLLILVSAMLFAFAFTKDASGGHLFPRYAGFLFVGMYLLYNVWVVRTVHVDHDREITEELIQENRLEGRSRTATRFVIFLIMLGVGLGMLVYGAGVFVDGAVNIARLVGISELVISLTILAVGTSLPELVVSSVAAFRGKCDIAIGNVIGSNTFNLLAILGLTTTLVPGGLRLSDAMFRFDIPILLGTAVLASVLCITGKKLSRWEGATLVGVYGIYIGSLLVR